MLSVSTSKLLVVGIGVLFVSCLTACVKLPVAMQESSDVLKAVDHGAQQLYSVLCLVCTCNWYA